MPLTEETLRTKLADLRARAAAVGLKSAQHAASAAEAAHEDAKQAFRGRQLNDQERQEATDRLNQTGQAATNARYILNSAASKDRELRPEIDRLARLLGGKDRAAAAVQRTSVADELVASASRRMSRCRSMR
ncbi:hypothetical protein [Piscinibacter gummiphilus]|uniref:Uncharacterized protein n=1 Tax=Piscinibacter gummiphilus TaxID=946333 RepID=A0ABZ0D0R5_9BURK|nr:hypothetical protein [Piscinibacter gummiphilus]WOB10757.1 hypothetical protein RXV79_12035 [Piscinibacter gummiphilus]